MRGTRTKRHFEQSVLIKFCFRRMVIKDETFLRQKLNQNYCLIKLFEIMQVWTWFFLCVSIHLVKFLSWYLNSAWDENLCRKASIGCRWQFILNLKKRQFVSELFSIIIVKKIWNKLIWQCTATKKQYLSVWRTRNVSKDPWLICFATNGRLLSCDETSLATNCRRTQFWNNSGSCDLERINFKSFGIRYMEERTHRVTKA